MFCIFHRTSANFRNSTETIENCCQLPCPPFATVCRQWLAHSYAPPGSCQPDALLCAVKPALPTNLLGCLPAPLVITKICFPWLEVGPPARSATSWYLCSALAAFTSYLSPGDGAAVAAVWALGFDYRCLYQCLSGVLQGRMTQWTFVGPSPVGITQRRDSRRLLFHSVTIAVHEVASHLPARQCF